jgi:hypothetical protein
LLCAMLDPAIIVVLFYLVRFYTYPRKHLAFSHYVSECILQEFYHARHSKSTCSATITGNRTTSTPFPSRSNAPCLRDNQNGSFIQFSSASNSCSSCSSLSYHATIAPRDHQLRNRRSYSTPANCNNSSAWCRRSSIEFSFWICCLSYGISHCPHLRTCCYSSDGCGATCYFPWFGPRRNFR